MNNKPNVRFVNAHPEGNGSYNHLHVLVQEKILSFGPQLAIQPRMIGDGLDAIGYQHIGQLFGGLPVKRIDDATLSFMLYNITNDTFNGLVLLDLGLDLVIKIAPVKGRDEYSGIAQAQVLYDVALHLWRGGRRQGDDRRVGTDLIHHLPQTAVFRPEIMSPFGNTVRFIHGKEGDLQIAEEIHILLLGEGFRGHIQHFGMAIQEVLMDRADLFFIECGIQKMGYIIFAAIATDQVYLVLHQGDQRAYDNSHPLTDHRRQLITETFSSAGRHDDKSILPCQQALYDSVLIVFKGVKAKLLL